jgi:predicted DNA-binding transcriptional regulator AlpA
MAQRSQKLTPPTGNDPLLRAKAAAAHLGISVSTYWRWVGAGRIPAGIRLSRRCTAWRRSTLDAFVASAASEE